MRQGVRYVVEHAEGVAEVLAVWLQPSGEFAVFQEEADQASELPGVLWGGLELVLELEKSVSILELSSSSRYGFAGLRLRPLLARDRLLLQLVPLHFQLDCWMPTCCSSLPPWRQRGEECLLAAVGGGKRVLRGWRCGHIAWTVLLNSVISATRIAAATVIWPY